MISRFRDFGSTADKERSGTSSSIRNTCLIQRVSLSVAVDLKTSTRQRSSQLGISLGVKKQHHRRNQQNNYRYFRKSQRQLYCM